MSDLEDAVAEMRALWQLTGWSRLADPYGELMRMRHGDDGVSEDKVDASDVTWEPATGEVIDGVAVYHVSEDRDRLVEALERIVELSSEERPMDADENHHWCNDLADEIREVAEAALTWRSRATPSRA